MGCDKRQQLLLSAGPGSRGVPPPPYRDEPGVDGGGPSDACPPPTPHAAGALCTLWRGGGAVRTARGPPQRRCHAGAELGARIPSVTTATGMETAAVALRCRAGTSCSAPREGTAGPSTPPLPVPPSQPRGATPPPPSPRDSPLRIPHSAAPSRATFTHLFNFQTTAASADARRMRSQLRDPPAPPGASARGSAAPRAHCSPTQSPRLPGSPTPPPPPTGCTLSTPPSAVFTASRAQRSAHGHAPPSRHRSPISPPTPRTKQQWGLHPPSPVQC